MLGVKVYRIGAAPLCRVLERLVYLAKGGADLTWRGHAQRTEGFSATLEPYPQGRGFGDVLKGM